MKRRVVITGLGIVSAAGNSVPAFWKFIRDGRCGIRHLSHFNENRFTSQNAAEVSDFRLTPPLPPLHVKRLDRYAEFVLEAAWQALQHSQLELSTARQRDDVGISFGTALGGLCNAEPEMRTLLESSKNSISPYLALQVFGGAAHSNIAIAFGARGYASTNSNSCASGTVAIGEGLRAIREGLADVMITGGAEAPLYPLTYGAFDVIRAMSRQDDPSIACRPFDANRDGFVMGEGAAALILEELNHALRRGVLPLAEVCGYSLNNDAHHMTQSRPDLACTTRAMQDALRDAEVGPEQIDLINAHGSGTKLNDENEARSIASVFGERKVRVHATKGYYGHPLGASGAIEGLLATLILQEGWVPHTLGCKNPEFPDWIDLLCEKGCTQPVGSIVSNSFGFGGINSCLVFKKFVK